MSLNLDDIRYFTTVCECLNVTRASEIIGISQPALSYAIKRLENEFGAKLLIRLKNGIQLTKVGEEFYKRAKRLILVWEESQNLFTDDEKNISGEFSLGAHPSVAIYSLPKILPQMTEQFPCLNFKIVHGLSREITQKVINWEIDFAIVINPISHPDLVIKEIGKDTVTLFKTKKSLNKLILDPSLAQSTFVLKGLKKAGLEFTSYLHSSNLEVVAKLASTGLGHGLLPTRVAQGYPELKVVKSAPKFEDKVCLIYRKEKHSNPVSQSLLNIIRQASI